MGELYLIRHGETEWSRDGRHTGRTDISLTETGRAQAQVLRRTLDSHPFGRVLTSPLERAVETCRLAGLGERAETTDGLLEWDYGDYEGLTSPEIHAQRPSWSLWRDGCPGGESPAEIGARVDRLLDRLLDLDGDAALFGHGHALRVLAARWLDLEPAIGSRLALSVATLSVLGFEHEVDHVIRRWNAPVADPSPDSE